jgi:hypothetical protein
MFKKFAILALLSIMAVSCGEDFTALLTGNVDGIVVDEVYGNGIEDVKITTEPASSVVYSRKHGNFLVDNMEVGEYTFKFEKEGYKTTYATVNVVAGKTTTLEVIMNGEGYVEEPRFYVNLLTPANNSEVYNGSTFRWNAEASENGISYYNFYLAKENSELEIYKTNISNNYLQVEDLEIDESYTWKVEAIDKAGNSISSEVWSFGVMELVIEDRLVAYLPMDGNGLDFSGRGNNATMYNVFNSADRNGEEMKALEFDGETSGMIFDDQTELQLLDGYTIAFWVNPNPEYGIPYASEIHLVGRFDSFGNSSFCVGIWTGGYLGTLKQIGIHNYIDISDYKIEPNEWNHIVVTYDKSVIKFYANGELVDVKERSGKLDYSTARMSIGYRAFNSTFRNRHFSGKMDELKIYDIPLSEEEAKAIYNQ